MQFKLNAIIFSIWRTIETLCNKRAFAVSFEMIYLRRFNLFMEPLWTPKTFNLLNDCMVFSDTVQVSTRLKNDTMIYYFNVLYISLNLGYSITKSYDLMIHVQVTYLNACFKKTGHYIYCFYFDHSVTSSSEKKFVFNMINQLNYFPTINIKKRFLNGIP